MANQNQEIITVFVVFSYSISERNVLDYFVVVVVFFSVFIFSVPSKVVIIEIWFMLSCINMFWDLLRAHYNPCVMAQAEMSLV